MFLERQPAASLGTLFACIVCVTTLISLLFYVGVACRSGLKSLREAKQMRVERREARHYRKMNALDLHATFGVRNFERRKTFFENFCFGMFYHTVVYTKFGVTYFIVFNDLEWKHLNYRISDSKFCVSLCHV